MPRRHSRRTSGFDLGLINALLLSVTFILLYFICGFFLGSFSLSRYNAMVEQPVGF